MKVVIFACVHNAGRSQIAAAFMTRLANPLLACAISAGTQPALRVHPEVVSVMQEVGVDLSSAQPQFLSDDFAQSATHLITMGCGDACPHIVGLQREDWPLEDPTQKPIARVREIRDDIEQRVRAFLQREDVSLDAHHR
jgi:arsenate reductase (thioredoxin)